MPLKVLLGHNYYLQPGGEDTAFSAEGELLRSHGHEVVEYVEDNRRITAMPSAAVAVDTIWSRESYDRLSALLARERPDVAHFHNTFPLISPSGYYACQRAGVPVIQSLDNPRLLCPSANFYRDGHPCEDCLGKTPPWPSVIHRCYHHSALQTAVVATMLTLHRLRRTWSEEIGLYLVASEFYRNKFIEGGLPPQKIRVRPYFVSPDPGPRLTGQPGEYALFIGRLDPEKGVKTLLDAWAIVRDIPLKICGSGQLDAYVQEFIQLHGLTDSVEVLGRLPPDQLITLIKGARFLVWPSEGHYETFGYVAVEAFACGVPVISSDRGVQAEIVEQGVTGLHFLSGHAPSLAEKLQWAWDHPAPLAQMGLEARTRYLSKYTAERGYPLLLEIYDLVIASTGQQRHAS